MPKDQQIAYEIDLMVDGLPGAGVYVRSKHVPGLHLIGQNFKAIKPTIEKAIKRLFKDNRNVDVNVIWIAEAKAFQHSTALPSKLAIYKVAA